MLFISELATNFGTKENGENNREELAEPFSFSEGLRTSDARVRMYVRNLQS